MLKSIIDVLQPFAAYSQLVSADKYVNFSSAVSCIEELKLHLQKSAESPGLNGIACAMLADLSKGFDFMTEKDDPDFDFTYLLATCLNCNYRIFVIEKPDVLKLVLNNIEKIAKQLGLQYYTNKVQSNDPDANLIVSPSLEETQANHDSNGYENLNVAHFSYCWRKRRPVGCPIATIMYAPRHLCLEDLLPILILIMTIWPTLNWNYWTISTLQLVAWDCRQQQPRH